MSAVDDLARERHLTRCKHMGALLAVADSATHEFLQANPDSQFAAHLRRVFEDIDRKNTEAAHKLDADLQAVVERLKTRPDFTEYNREHDTYSVER